MNSVLLAEASATRRRAAALQLERRNWKVIAPGTIAECCRLLSGNALEHVDAVLLGWPQKPANADLRLQELLRSDALSHLPVTILSENEAPALLQWCQSRPRTSRLSWADYTRIDVHLNQATAQSLPRLSEDTDPGLRQRVLLMDSSPTARSALKRLISQHGYEVEVARSAAEGMQMAIAQPFDIALVDFHLPDENGATLIGALHHHPQTRHLMVAVLADHYSDEIIVQSLAAGAAECLSKSETRELFLARLASLARNVRDRRAIDAERRRLEGILAAVGDGVFGVEDDGTILFVNPAATRILGYQDSRALIGRRAPVLIHPGSHGGWDSTELDMLSLCYRDGKTLSNWQSVFWTAGRLPIPVEGTVHPLHVDGARRGSVVAFRDVSARRKLEEQLRWQAEYDSLTGLHNRAWFERILDTELQRLHVTGEHSALLFVDMDRFKYINDTAGHSAGDQLLVEVSRRLRAHLRSEDQIARMGGDEYAILLHNVCETDIALIADTLRTAVCMAPFSHAGKTYRITLSIGATSLDRRTPSPEAAMARADLACYRSKNAGRSRCHVYNPEHDDLTTMSEELGWSTRLLDALAEGRFELVFQPIVPLHGIEQEVDQVSAPLWQRQFLRNPGTPMIFEALLRLRDVNGQLILPSAFMPSAERFGLMADLDRCAITRAIDALHEARHHWRPIALTVNLSADSLADDSLPDFVTHCLAQRDVNPSALIFEITESRTLQDIVGVQTLLRRLRLLGCKIAIDDFGTGFSTFAYLRQLDADFLKIDGSIVQGLPDDALDRTVIAALASIAESTGKLTVAEWVENVETLKVLHECGVNFAQGFVIGHPLGQLPQLPWPASDNVF